LGPYLFARYYLVIASMLIELWLFEVEVYGAGLCE
jgi:hypothetical protein